MADSRDKHLLIFVTVRESGELFFALDKWRPNTGLVIFYL